MAAYRAVRFIETCVVQDARAGTPDEIRYEKDSVHVLPYQSAQHWIKRDKAKEEDTPENPPPPPPPPPPRSVKGDVPKPPPPEVLLPSEDQEPDDSDEMTVAEAIDELDPDNPDHWTASGKPAVDALSAIMGRTVTAAERDAAID